MVGTDSDQVLGVNVDLVSSAEASHSYLAGSSQLIINDKSSSVIRSFLQFICECFTTSLEKNSDFGDNRITTARSGTELNLEVTVVDSNLVAASLEVILVV